MVCLIEQSVLRWSGLHSWLIIWVCMLWHMNHSLASDFYYNISVRINDLSTFSSLLQEYSEEATTEALLRPALPFPW